MFVFSSKLLKRASVKKIICFAEKKAVTDNIYKEYIVTGLVEDENTLSYICEKSDEIGASLIEAALSDITAMLSALSDDPLKGYAPTTNRKSALSEYEESVKELVKTEAPKDLLFKLIEHYKKFGAGKNAKYIAFKWDKLLKAVKKPDGITLDKLYCLQEQKASFTGNIERFLNNKPYNNVILYGSRGSGKSSMVKASLNEFHASGLRMVEISKNNLHELPELIDAVKNKKFKYIVFFDDLSFENDDTQYKHLKVMMDGQIEKQPVNILFCATSNRRHLVNESWGERQGGDVHINDTLNEKLSLAERFGLSIYFPKISQNDYFEIIGKILENNGVAFSDEIRKEAVKWEIAHSGRSGRTAAQFAGIVAAK